MRLRAPSSAASIRLSLALVACALLCVAAEPAAPHVPNFDRVNSRLFRGGAPALVGLQELAAMGVKLDLDLRESGDATKFEKEQAEKLGMRYVNIPFSAFSAPAPSQIERVLSILLRDDSGPVFVHCRRGKDRTGTVIACYRIQHDGWDNQRALSEAKQHGMSFAERGMRSYVLHFTPLPLSASLKPVK